MHFRIGGHHLRGLIDATQAGRQYSDLAEVVLAALWPVVVEQFAQKHGPMPGRGGMVLGMGSLGAQRLNASSDLDLIVIYDADGVEFSDGRRPLASRAYYARLTQALVTAVTAQMSEGRLYEVDMRLRPSGTQGPVATSVASFMDYQQNQAWTWEHLALTRARPVAGVADLMDEIEAFRRKLIASPSSESKVREDLLEMRAPIPEAKAPEGLWDAKIGAGRLQDIELIAQAAVLLAGGATRDVAESLQNGVSIEWITEKEFMVLSESYALHRTLQAATRLLGERALDPEAIGAGGVAFILREVGAESFEALQAKLSQTAQRAGETIERVLARTVKGRSHV